MTTQIVFYTPTMLPKACLFTMGISAKEGDNPIGFFGTGLKYAIAICMRLGAEIEIMSVEGNPIDHGELITFTHECESVRNKEFNIIYANIMGDVQRMPMTLDYGKTWEPWMALRELYTNTLDENGEMWEDTDSAPHYPRDRAGTYITITCDDDSDLLEAWNTRFDTWLLDTSRTPVWKNYNLEVYMRPSSVLFYRGMRVSQKGFESAVTYNILKPFTLTEDRTIDLWDFRYYLQTDYIQVDRRDVAARIIEASGNEKMIESGMYFNQVTEHGSIAMREEMLRLYRADPNKINSTARDAATHYIRKHHFDDMYVAVQLTDVQQKKHDRCTRLLNDHGFQLHKYRIRWCELSAYTMGMADANTNTILLNIALMNEAQWHEKICTTMMEEYIHLEHNVNDATRQFQDRTLEMMYDVMIKKPVRGSESLLGGLKKISDGTSS